MSVNYSPQQLNNAQPGPQQEHNNYPMQPPTAKTISTTTATANLRREFDKLFVDMEFRARRAALMNYHDAEEFQKKADLLQTISAIVGGLGVSGIVASIAKTKRVAANSAGMAGVLALPLSGILQFLSNGSSNMAPTVGEKARLHVKAGAGWQRIARECRAYRVQLKYLSDQDVRSPILPAWYRDMVQTSEVVSRILPIKPDTYIKFEQPETVRDRITKREGLLKKYLDMEAKEQNK